MNDPAAVVVGGGFYGCAIALHLAARGVGPVLLVERESNLLTRASHNNQARVHNGYHYPRSFVTAYRSRINAPRFNRDYAGAIDRVCTSLYAITRQQSKVTPAQFEHFLTDIGATFAPADAAHAGLFEPRLVAAVYKTDEAMFNAALLRRHFLDALPAAGVQVVLNTTASLQAHGRAVQVHLRGPAAAARTVAAKWVFNCTYAGFNSLLAGVQTTGLTPLKHEVAELALIETPDAVRGLNITVMDGPFFSLTRFPAADCHCLTHVRYTPHEAQIDAAGGTDPLQQLRAQAPQTRVHFMVADSARYLPCLRHIRYRGSLFEMKTVLAQREVDDGRPILLRREPAFGNLVSVLGGKIDNIYDVLERLDLLLS